MGKADKKEMLDSIACCGLICRLCHLAGECDGCRGTANRCDAHSAHWGGCFNRNCCREKGIEGCWACGDFPCDRGMFDPAVHDRKLRAYVRCIREDGAAAFVDYIERNAGRGIRYGYRKDYDGLGSEDEVLRLLRTGRK